MLWYHAIVKQILNGLIFFLFPLILVIFLLGKAVGFVRKLILPIKEHLPEHRILGLGLLTLISIVLLLFICYIAGMLWERKRIKTAITKLEDNVLIYIPGYAFMKSRAGEAISNTADHWQAVLVGDNNEWKPGIEVERHSNGYCSVFFPEPPDGKSGAMALIHESKIKLLNIPVSQLVKMVRRYGQGGASWMNEVEKPDVEFHQ